MKWKVCAGERSGFNLSLYAKRMVLNPQLRRLRMRSRGWEALVAVVGDATIC